MAYQVVSQRCTFQKVDPESPTIPVGDVEIVERGGMVPDYVPSFIVNALVSAGMIMPVSEPDPMIIPIEVEPMQPVGPDTPIVLPTGQSTITETSSIDADSPVVEPAPAAKPKHTDSRAKWEAYATSPAIGMSEGEAEEYANKTELIAAVEQVEAGKAAAEDDAAAENGADQ